MFQGGASAVNYAAGTTAGTVRRHMKKTRVSVCVMKIHSAI